MEVYRNPNPENILKQGEMSVLRITVNRSTLKSLSIYRSVLVNQINF